MEYIFPALYKYLAIILIFFMFIRHYKSIDQDSYLLICILFVVFAMMMDYYLVHNHPDLFSTKKNPETFDNLEEEFEDIDDKPTDDQENDD